VPDVNVCTTTEKARNKHPLSWAGIAGENHWLTCHLMRGGSSQLFGTAGLRAAREEQAVPCPLRRAPAVEDRACQAAQTRDSSWHVREGNLRG